MNAPILEATEEKLERVRSYFRGDLLVLRETLLRMASIAHTNLQLALESLVERSAEKAKKAIQDDMEIDRLEVEVDELVKRLVLRGQTSGRVDDQDEDTIRNRFREYQNKTLPLQSFYQQQAKYQSVKGIGEIDEIFASLCSCIDGLKHG